MFKKFIIITSLLLLFITTCSFAKNETTKPYVQPLKIEQNHHKYKYGNLEKTFKNPAKRNIQANEFSSDSSRRVPTILDILNIAVISIIIFIICFITILKLKKITLRDFIYNSKNHRKKDKFIILSAKQLENGKTVYLLEVNAKQIIVGTTESKIDIIVPLDKTYTENDVPQEYIENLFTNNTEEFKNLEE